MLLRCETLVEIVNVLCGTYFVSKKERKWKNPRLLLEIVSIVRCLPALPFGTGLIIDSVVSIPLQSLFSALGIMRLQIAMYSVVGLASMFHLFVWQQVGLMRQMNVEMNQTGDVNNSNKPDELTNSKTKKRKTWMDGYGKVFIKQIVALTIITAIWWNDYGKMFLRLLQNAVDLKVPDHANVDLYVVVGVSVPPFIYSVAMAQISAASFAAIFYYATVIWKFTEKVSKWQSGLRRAHLSDEHMAAIREQQSQFFGVLQQLNERMASFTCWLLTSCLLLVIVVVHYAVHFRKLGKVFTGMERFAGNPDSIVSMMLLIWAFGSVAGCMLVLLLIPPVSLESQFMKARDVILKRSDRLLLKSNVTLRMQLLVTGFLNHYELPSSMATLSDYASIAKTGVVTIVSLLISYVILLVQYNLDISETDRLYFDSMKSSS